MKLVGLGLLLLLGVALLVALRGSREEGAPVSPDSRQLSRRARTQAWVQRLVPVITGLAAGGLMLWLTVPAFIAVSVAVLVAAMTAVGLRSLEARRVGIFESQLADGIDLMVSTLRAGGGLTDALGGAIRETRAPFRGVLSELVERIRLGDAPREVLEDLEERIDLESFRLFSFTLGAHFEGGGSLATTLSDVGRSIRDRVDVARRVRSQAVETQASVVGVLVVTYGLALLMWNNYPDRMVTFTESELGSMAIAFTILLQGVGLLWITRISRVEV